MVKVVGVSLEALKTALSTAIDSEAEGVRGQFVTLNAGQAMVYDQKRREAEQLAATPGMDTSALVMLTAEATARGITVAALATEVTTAANQWVTLGALIEAIRVPAKAAVAAATTAADANTARVLDWTPVYQAAGQ